ncbi:hypothetical protein ACUN24_08160 [Pedobacter sp. WC2501]|uniref:hypothetical protein n=1 Tax=Pedobacter sp. WC2501 TaxID=3461400 RepID=UPI004045A506
MILDFIKRRYIALISLAPYFAFWALCFVPADPSKKNCGAANAGLLIIMPLSIAFTTITFLVLIHVNKGQERKDFKTILLLTYLPLFIGIINLVT